MDLTVLETALNTGWILLGAALVFFMQAGFAMVETGFTRAKNAGNIIMKNLMDFSLGTPIFWLIGFGIMFGGSGKLIGGLDLFTNAGGDWATLIFQTVFCATAATIVSGAMAERTKFSAYCIYSMVISAVIYPISGHWIWGGGWLAQMGFHDFAGSTAVHMVGGVAAFIGAAILGPRIGKYGKDGKARAILGHSLTLGALGVFILWFCWFGFNGCSTVALTGGADVTAARVFVTTNLAAAVATVTVMCITWIRYGKPDVSMTLNGSLAGLVAITAGCDMVTPAGAAAIGIIAGFVVVFGIEFIDQVVKVDDPVGAVGVHGLCGATGTLLTGVFAYYNGNKITKEGLIYGGGFHMLGVQVLGVAAVIAWVVVTMTIVFMILKKTIGLRVTAEEEIMGLDKPERLCGLHAGGRRAGHRCGRGTGAGERERGPGSGGSGDPREHRGRRGDHAQGRHPDAPVPLRGAQERDERHRRDGHDAHERRGLRRAEGRGGVLPRRAGGRDAAAEDQAGDRRLRRAGGEGDRGCAQGAVHRSHRRRQDLRLRRGGRREGSHRRARL